MRVLVVGLGHIGLVNVAVLLKAAHSVVGVDSNDKIRDLVARGLSPFREPGVAPLIEGGLSAGLLSVAANVADATTADVIYVCVDTRGSESGTLDLSNVKAIAGDIGKALRGRSLDLPPLVLVFRSTMLPGSMRDVVLPMLEDSAGEPPGTRYEPVYHPEFTREGTALADCLTPGRIVLGERRKNSSPPLLDLFRGIDAPVFSTSFEVAELTKFADNTFHALKVAFANEIGRFALRSGISPRDVFDIFLADTKLNLSASYLRPGAPFGGPCIPKDLSALRGRIEDIEVAAPILQHIAQSNSLHNDFLIEEIGRKAAPRSRVLLLGLSFKADTNDVRDSQFATIANALLDRGYDLSIYDPDFVRIDAERPTDGLSPRLAAVVLPDISVSTGWDLVIVGKPMPDLLQSFGDKYPLFHIDHL